MTPARPASRAPRRAFVPGPALAPPIVHRVLRAPGRPLDAGTRAELEPRFGHSFADVRVHADGEAAASARAVGAHAYTVGRDVVFAAGRYAPGSAEGKRLMAHELAHVVQQRGAGPASLQPRLEIGAADDPAEREAERAAEAVAGGGAALRGGDAGAGAMARRREGAAILRRVCECGRIPGAHAPSPAEEASMASDFPNLRHGDWCVTGPPTRSYNCFALSIGEESFWLDGTDVDARYGDRDGRPEPDDFDGLYRTRGLHPGRPESTLVEVALYGDGGIVNHAARRRAVPCGYAFESKLGTDLRIIHDAHQLEGGLYGYIVRSYGHAAPTMAPPRAPRERR